MTSCHVDYADEVHAAHRALWRAGFTTDVVPVGSELSPYRLVIVPCLYAVSDATAAWLRGYLAGGGHVVATYLSGVAGEYARIRLGGYPGALRELLGVRVDEFLPLDPADRVALDDGANGSLWSERVHLAGATVVASYREGVLSGGPAITRHSPAPGSGGDAWYVSTRLDDAAYQRMLTGACIDGTVTLPAGGAAVVREHERS